MSVRYVLRPQIVNHQVTGRFRLVSLRTTPTGVKPRMTATTGLVIAGAASLLLWMLIVLIFA